MVPKWRMWSTDGLSLAEGAARILRPVLEVGSLTGCSLSMRPDELAA
jgi:hypothetical protein